MLLPGRDAAPLKDDFAKRLDWPLAETTILVYTTILYSGREGSLCRISCAYQRSRWPCYYSAAAHHRARPPRSHTPALPTPAPARPAAAATRQFSTVIRALETGLTAPPAIPARAWSRVAWWSPVLDGSTSTYVRTITRRSQRPSLLPAPSRPIAAWIFPNAAKRPETLNTAD